MSVCCVLMAAGSGTRLGLGPKGMVRVGGRSLLARALDGLAGAGVEDIVLVLPPESHRLPADVYPAAGLVSVCGGPTRQESVRLGLAALSPQADVVLVHDAARCLTPARVIADVIATVLAGAEVVVPVVPLTDTLRWATGGCDEPAPARERLVAVQTPQGFAREVLLRAHQVAHECGVRATDDATLAEQLGHQVRLTEGDELAFKVTQPLDLTLAEALVAAQAPVAQQCAPGNADEDGQR